MKKQTKLLSFLSAAVLFCCAPLSAFAEEEAAETEPAADTAAAEEDSGAVLGETLIAPAPSADATPSGIAADSVTAEVSKWADEHKNTYVSFASAVFNRNDIYPQAFGLANREKNLQADTDTCYDWGSCSKTLVWVSVMQLYEQGKIDLDKDVREYLPAGFLKKTRFSEPITMTHLMNHMGGWGENNWAMQCTDEKDILLLPDALQQCEPVQTYRPGTFFSYSNFGAALAGYVVECITGEDFGSYVHLNIFEPLGIGHTAITPAHADVPAVKENRAEVASYTQNPLTGAWSEVSSGSYVMPYPAGAVTGTIGDMALYAQALIAEDCPLFEKPETRDLLFTPSALLGSTDHPLSFHGFFSTEYKNCTAYGHNGAANGFTANLVVDPVSGWGVCVLMNGTGEPTAAVPRLIFGDEKTEEEVPEGSITDQTDFTGLYFSTRSVRRGPLKFMSLLGFLPVVKNGDTYDVPIANAKMTPTADGVLKLEQNGITATVVNGTMDGEKYISLSGQSYITDKWGIPALIALILYALSAFIGLILLIVKFFARIAKKRDKYVGMGAFTFGQFMRLVSVGVIIWWLVNFSVQYGITKLQGYIGCGIHALALLAFVIAFFASVRGMFTKKEEKAGFGKYFCNFIGSAISAFAVVILELPYFWS